MAADPCELAEQYIEDVLSGEILTCKPVYKAVERHKADLRNGKRRGLRFDKEAARRALSFFPFLKHSKGKWAGQPFVLSPWQAFIVYSLFGWKRADNTRRFRVSYVEVPRKNGKSTFAAGIGLYMLIGDGEAGAEVYTAATTRDQAKICFTEAQNMVRKSSAIQKRATVLAHNINVAATASKMEALSSDYNTLDGPNPHCVILDEIHAYKTSGLYDIFTSAVGAREQPLIFMITTAGFNQQWFCFQQRKYGLQVLEGSLHDDELFVMVFTLDDDDEWTDEAVWGKANPNLGESPSLSYLRGRVHTAKQKPSEQVNVKTKNLDIWTSASKTWITAETYKLGNGAGRIDETKLAGMKYFGGMDLASISDFAAKALLFEKPESPHHFWLLLRCWIPEASVSKRIEEGLADLQKWIDEGWVRVTPGNVTDYGYIKQDVLDDAETFDLQSIAYDRWNSSHLVQELDEELGTVERLDENGKREDVSRMSPFGQGFNSMSTPTKEFEKYMLEGAIEHGGNPVLAWMLGNTVLRYDPAGNVKPDKQKSGEKIDGVVATIQAIGEYLTFGINTPTNYDDHYATYGIRSI